MIHWSELKALINILLVILIPIVVAGAQDNSSKHKKQKTEDEREVRTKLAKAVLDGIIPLNSEFIVIDRSRERENFAALFHERAISISGLTMKDAIDYLSKEFGVPLIPVSLLLRSEEVVQLLEPWPRFPRHNHGTPL